MPLLVTLLDVMLDHMYCVCRQKKQEQIGKMTKQTAKIESHVLRMEIKKARTREKMTKQMAEVGSHVLCM